MGGQDGLADTNDPQALGNDLFGPVKARQEDTARAIQEVSHDLSRLQLQRQCRRDQVVGDLEQLARQARQLFHRQAAMPLAHRLGQCVADAGTDPDQGCLLDPDLCGDLIRGPKSDPANVLGQAVGVLTDDPYGLIAVGLVDPYRPRGADSVGMQEQHDVPDDLLLGPAGDDPCRTLDADTGYLAQTLRLLLNEVEHGFAEAPHQPLGIDRADPADHA